MNTKGSHRKRQLVRQKTARQKQQQEALMILVAQTLKKLEAK